MNAESGPSMESIKSFNGEVLSRGFLLSEQFRKSGVLGEKKDDNERDKANEEVRRILNTSFIVGKVAETQVQPIIDFNSVSDMVNITRNEGLSDFLRQRANNALYETGLALSLDKTVFKAATEGNLEEVVPSNLHGIEPYILSSYLTTGRDDKDGQELVKELVGVFRLKKRADSDPGYFKKDFEEKTKDLFGKLLDKYDESTGEDESSGNVGRWETMMGYIKGIDDKTKREPVLTEVENNGTIRVEGSKKENKNNSGPDLAAMRDNRYAKDPKSEYRSPYEIDPSSFVDALFNQQNPRLYFTPPPEWVRKLPPKEQYLLKIQQKLASGAEYKLGVKDISAEKARQSEVYNLPETELKFIYEMPGVKEALETFVGDLLEPYSEDGRVFSRLKLGPDGRIDKSVAKKCGDIDSGFSFEGFKEEMYKKMALKKLYPNKIGEINSDWETVYKDAIKDYIKKTRDDFKNFKGNRGIIDNRTDAELENKWITDNALEEKRAVATAWNFLFVGHVIESADTKRSLKPSQINSDKLRTMMMPLEKFLQKASIRKGSLQGSEELFGGNLSLWAKRRMEEEGTNFSQKLVYAADNDRTEMTDEQAKWRLMPKRTMCSFSDEYHVKTKDGEEMTFSEALRNKKEIVFKENDLDVFVSLRDTWDEVISVSPFLIGKGEYSPVQQPDKFASAVEKLKGLVTGINKIRLTPEEAARQGRAFGHEKYVDCPEFYAWLIANAVGIEINLDTPILNRAAIKADSDNYDVIVNNFVRLLNLNTGISLKVKEILNAEGWLSSKRAISIAEKRASVRESKRIKEEKRRR